MPPSSRLCRASDQPQSWSPARTRFRLGGVTAAFTAGEVSKSEAPKKV